MTGNKLLLYSAIIDIDERYINEAQAASTRKPRQVLYRLAVTAACLCLVVLSAAALNKRHVTAADLTNSASMNVLIYQDESGVEEAVWLYTIIERMK